MKFCPKCKSNYNGDLDFCLQDGTLLTEIDFALSFENEQETLIRSKPLVLNDTVNLENVAPPKKETAEAENEDDSKQSLIPTAEWNNEKPNSEPSEQPQSGNDGQALKDERSFTSPHVSISPSQVYEGLQAPDEGRKSYLGAMVGGIGIFGLLLLGTAIGGAYYFWNQPQAELSLANIDIPNTDYNSNLDVGNAEDKRKDKKSKKKFTKPTQTPNKKIPAPKPSASKNPKPTQSPISPTPTPNIPKRITRISKQTVTGLAIDLPKPRYPRDARALRAGGIVRVLVVIDKSGKVISAKAISGHPLLLSAATRAAKRAKFARTIIQGQPVEVSGFIDYNFIR